MAKNETTVEKEDKPKKEVNEKKPIDMHELNAWMRFAMLKTAIRNVNLEKDESGYNNQYQYVALKDIQKEFVRLEEKHLLTSIYSEKTESLVLDGGGVKILNFATRVLVDLISGTEIAKTEIDITNLKQASDPFEIKAEVLRITSPKDAWKKLYMNYFEPQELGGISTYMQRYTYNQLYDFQETKADKIEKDGKVQGDLKVEDKKDNTGTEDLDAKTKRLEDTGAEIRSRIKSMFEVEDIKKELDGRKLKNFTSFEEANKFLNTMIEKYETKEEKANKEKENKEKEGEQE